MTCPGSRKTIDHTEVSGQGVTLKAKCPECKRMQQVMLLGKEFEFLEHQQTIILERRNDERETKRA